MGEPSEPSDEHRDWSSAVAGEYTLDELSALNTWLDTNIQLNQVRLESLTSRLLAVLAVAGILLSVLVTATTSKGVALTIMSCVVLVVGVAVVASGLGSVRHSDNDPSTTWETMWGPRLPGEVLAMLLGRRGFLYEDQRKLIDKRAATLQLASFVTVVSGVLTLAAVIVSRTN